MPTVIIFEGCLLPFQSERLERCYVQKSIKTLPKWLSRLHSLSALPVPGSDSELVWSALNFHINCTDFGTIWSSEAINAELIRTELEH